MNGLTTYANETCTKFNGFSENTKARIIVKSSVMAFALTLFARIVSDNFIYKLCVFKVTALYVGTTTTHRLANEGTVGNIYRTTSEKGSQLLKKGSRFCEDSLANCKKIVDDFSGVTTPKEKEKREIDGAIKKVIRFLDDIWNELVCTMTL